MIKCSLPQHKIALAVILRGHNFVSLVICFPKWHVIGLFILLYRNLMSIRLKVATPPVDLPFKGLVAYPGNSNLY
jgi:hypothetical protein